MILIKKFSKKMKIVLFMTLIHLLMMKLNSQDILRKNKIKFNFKNHKLLVKDKKIIRSLKKWVEYLFMTLTPSLKVVLRLNSILKKTHLKKFKLISFSQNKKLKMFHEIFLGKKLKKEISIQKLIKHFSKIFQDFNLKEILVI